MTTNRTVESHPSYLALDRASLGETSSELAAHLQNCGECRAYVASQAEPPPASGFLRIQQRLEVERRSKRRAFFTLLPAVAAAASVLVFLAMRPQPELPAGPKTEAPYVGTKGFTSVWIYVKHGPNTELWDGKRSLFVGDRLRLKLDPGRFPRVAVYSLKDPIAPTLLYAGNVTPAESKTLPDAWEVDGEPGPERLVVVFSDRAIEPNWPDWLQGKAPPEVTVLPFVLPKSSSPDSDVGPNGP